MQLNTVFIDIIFMIKRFIEMSEYQYFNYVDQFELEESNSPLTEIMEDVEDDEFYELEDQWPSNNFHYINLTK